jgi:two-component system, OmpR family, response regulator
MKLLLVEDDVRLAQTVRRGLVAEGFTVELAHDGDDGFWKASEGSFELVILDLMLPRRNGYAVCRDLRAADVWTPILVLTAKDGDLDEAEALDLGADDYLKKPFSFPVLVARIRALTRRASGRDPVPLQVDDLDLDPGSRRVVRAGTTITCTSREFAVLEHLVRRAGNVVSKIELIAAVWDDHFDGDPNIVEVYVRRLRKKVDEPFGRPLIHTVRGAGYRLAIDP